MDCTTADASPNYLQLEQRIEGQNLQHLLKGTSSAKAVTLSFWVKSNKTGTYIIEIMDNVNGRHISKSYTVDSASTWEKKTLTFEGDQTDAIVNSNSIGIYVKWWLGAGSSFTSGTLQTSWGAYSNANKAVGQVNLADSTSNEWYITGCQLEIGEAATDFEFEPYQTTINKCYRYCEKVDVRVIHVSRPNGAGNGGGYTNVYFKQSKRDAPTTTITTGVINVQRPDFVRITDGVTISANQISQFPNADHYIIADAEL